jgi:hypothetical protein
MIIGERTQSEIEYDNVVIESLNLGLPIESALKIAGEKYPNEAIRYDSNNVKDISEHYNYIKEHNEIIKIINNKNKMSTEQAGGADT